jgi:hypothetical protein
LAIRKVDEDGEDDPLVAVPPSREGVRGADRVAMQCLAVDMGTGMGNHRVVATKTIGPLAGSSATR